MSSPSSSPMCERRALTEAMFDGRLGPAERASTARHQKTCPDCRAHFHELSALRQGLQRSLATPTPLEHQRARLALLRVAADAGAAPPSPARKRSAPRALALLAAAAVLVPLAAWATVSLAPGPPTVAPASPAVSPTAVTPSVSATASHAHLQATSTPDAPAPPEAPAMATAQLASAAEKSNEIKEERPRSVAASAVMKPAARAVPSLHQEPREAASRGPLAPTRSRPEAKVAAVSSTPDGASRDFADALHALSDGDFGASAGKLDTFATSHPDDPRAEEAAYLKAIALERSGRVDEARAAARRYLDRYPAGAHRAQAQRLLVAPSIASR